MARDIATIVSHEVRNELSVLATWADYLRRAEPETAPCRQAAAAILRAVRIVNTLCGDLETLQACDDSPALERIPVDLSEIAASAADALTPDARHHGVDLERRVDAVPVWVIGDAARLGEIASNLIGNALRFTAAPGRIAIEVQGDGDTATLSVSDTGCGITAALLPHVFDKFRQGLPKAGRGRGLGLYVVKRLVELHGGSVKAESGGPGRGSRFVVTLPRVAYGGR